MSVKCRDTTFSGHSPFLSWNVRRVKDMVQHRRLPAFSPCLRRWGIAGTDWSCRPWVDWGGFPGAGWAVQRLLPAGTAQGSSGEDSPARALHLQRAAHCHVRCPRAFGTGAAPRAAPGACAAGTGDAHTGEAGVVPSDRVSFPGAHPWPSRTRGCLVPAAALLARRCSQPPAFAAAGRGSKASRGETCQTCLCIAGTDRALPPHLQPYTLPVQCLPVRQGYLCVLVHVCRG